MDVGSFEEIADEFTRRVSRIVWCTVSTVDRKDRPRSRILHPVWEGATGYIGTRPDSFKAKHLARNPYVSCTYWDPQQDIVYADCRAEWVEDVDERRRVWDLFKAAPEPYGYDPATIWQNGPGGDDYGVLRLTPWRIELYSMSFFAEYGGPLVWRAEA